MISLIQQHRPDIATLCRRYGVQSLDVFGSAAGDTFDPAHSDIDFLVAFNPAETTGLFQRFFGLQEALQGLFQRKIDLVSAAALSNPYFIAEVNRTRQTVYASAHAQAA
jgi:predicted nucleotidyltransferase